MLFRMCYFFCLECYTLGYTHFIYQERASEVVCSLVGSHLCLWKKCNQTLAPIKQFLKLIIFWLLSFLSGTYFMCMPTEELNFKGKGTLLFRDLRGARNYELHWWMGIVSACITRNGKYPFPPFLPKKVPGICG